MHPNKSYISQNSYAKDKSFKSNKMKNRTQSNLMSNTTKNGNRSNEEDRSSRNAGWATSGTYQYHHLVNKANKGKNKKTFKKTAIHYADPDSLRTHNLENTKSASNVEDKIFGHPTAENCWDAYDDSEDRTYFRYESPKNVAKKRYSKRKESVSSVSSSNSKQIMNKSRIPVPNAVKKLWKKSDEVSVKSHTQYSTNIRQPYTGQISEKDPWGYNSIEYLSQRCETKSNREIQMLELEPTILDYSTEEFTEEDHNNLVVNLEDLVNEEYYIHHISEAIHQKKPLVEYVRKWWNVTEKSTVKEMQVFFEEESSIKLIKTHQILLWIFMSYLEVNESVLFHNPKIRSSIKNIVNNLHRNYMVFIEFITKNLTDEQFYDSLEWTNKLEKVLQIRPVMKCNYKVNNSEILESNNKIAFSLIKDLLRSKDDESAFKKEANFILKNLQLVETTVVRDLMISSINVTKNFQISSNQNKKNKNGRWLKAQIYDVVRNENPKQFNNFSMVASSVHGPKWSDLIASPISKQIINPKDFHHEMDFFDRESSSGGSPSPLKASHDIHMDNRDLMMEDFIQRHNMKMLNLEDLSHSPNLSNIEGINSKSRPFNKIEFEGDSKDSLSCESETPIPVIPKPISPGVHKFPISQQPKTASMKSKENMLSRIANSLTPDIKMWKKAELKTPVRKLETSIDQYIKTECNDFIENLKSDDRSKNVLQDNKSTVNIPDSQQTKFTPKKLYSTNASIANTPVSSSAFNKKYQIKRSEEKKMSNSKSMDKGLGSSVKKSQIVHKKPASKFTWMTVNRSHLSRSNTYQMLNTERNAADKTQKDGLIDAQKELISPISNEIQDRAISETRIRSAKSVEANARNDRPFQYVNPREKQEEQTSQLNNVMKIIQTKEKSILEPKTATKKIEKKQVIDCSQVEITQTEPDVKESDLLEITMNDETFSLNESKDSPSKKNKYDVLDEFMTPKVTDNRKRAQSEENCFSNLNLNPHKNINDSHKSIVLGAENFSSSFVDLIPLCQTDRKWNKKLIDTSSMASDTHLNNLKLLKHFSEAKSKLPPSHLPTNQSEDSKKGEKLIEKLQQITSTQELEILPKSPLKEESSEGPKFLVIDTPEESLEELARIDAELAKVDYQEEPSLDEQSTLVSCNIHNLDLWRNCSPSNKARIRIHTGPWFGWNADSL
jgi:hypothetical protein